MRITRRFSLKKNQLKRNKFIFPRKYGSSHTTGPLKKTSLYNLHVELGAKIVPFAGWEMPLQYPEGLLQSHLHTREKSSFFDVSHMGQLRIKGKDRVEFVEYITVADVQNLPLNHATLSLITNDNGGINDDTMISNLGHSINMVVNAGCKDKDKAHIEKALGTFKQKKKDVTLEWLDNNSLIAIQGPETEKILQPLIPNVNLSKIQFLGSFETEVMGTKIFAQRSGYTGEDGFEISIPHKTAEAIVRQLLKNPNLKPCGLGARDTLRLEAGLCLYGNDLNETITPKQACLLWTISERRQKEGGFIGSDVVLQELKVKIPDMERRRIGFQINSKAPAREGATIHNEAGEQIGIVTSGTMSPSLQIPIGMGYVHGKYSKVGTKVKFNVRGKMIDGVIAKTPFVPTKYKK